MRSLVAIILWVIAGLLLLGSLASAGVSLFWFGMSHEPRMQLAQIQQVRHDKDFQRGQALLGIFGVGRFDDAELLATVALLATEKLTYQFLSLALFLLCGVLTFGFAAMRTGSKIAGQVPTRLPRPPSTVQAASPAEPKILSEPTDMLRLPCPTCGHVISRYARRCPNCKSDVQLN